MQREFACGFHLDYIQAHIRAVGKDTLCAFAAMYAL